jgi:nucleotide-binding universal stress UspA family protein
MPLRKILLANSGGSGGLRAADWLTENLAHADRAVHVVVLEPFGGTEMGTPGLTPSFPAASERDADTLGNEAKRILRDTQQHLKGFGQVTGAVMYGNRPVEEILEAIHQVHPDLVVVGRRGLSRLESMLLGSISSAAVTHSPVPVLVVPPA